MRWSTRRIKSAHDLGVGVWLFVRFLLLLLGHFQYPLQQKKRNNTHRNPQRVKQKSKDKHCIKNEEKWKYQRKQNIYYFFPLFTFRLAILERTPSTQHTAIESTKNEQAATKPSQTIHPSSQSSSPPQAESTRKQAIRRNWNRWGSWFFAFIECK